MGRRRGQVIARGKGVWLVKVYKGQRTEQTEQGPALKLAYVSQTVHGTKKQAETVLSAMLGDLDRGTLVERTRETLDAYLDRWLDSAAPQRPNTKREYAGLLTRYLRPVLGHRRLADLRPSDFQAVYTDLTGRGLAPRTVTYLHRVVFRALGQAAKWGDLARNPASGATLPKAEKREMHAFSPEQAKAFLAAAADSPHGLLFLVLLATGMRPSEALALRWRDLDLEAGTATIQRVLVSGTAGFADPKTKKSRRTLPFPASLTAALAARQAANTDPEALVFAGEAGQPLNEHNLVRRHFKAVLRAAGLPEVIRLYDLRHSMATLLLKAGVNPKIVSERLGHASIVLTLDTYSHVLPDMQAEAVAKLDSMLAPAAPALPAGAGS